MTKKIATALAGKKLKTSSQEAKSANQDRSVEIENVIRSLSERLLAEGVDAARIAAIITGMVASNDAPARHNAP